MTIQRLSTFLLTLLLPALAITLFAADAWAADATSGSFTCTNGSASGNLYVSGAGCPTTLQLSNVFSFLICNFEHLSSNLLGHMFCGMIYELRPAVWAVVTLAVVFFGVSFTIGLTPATGQEAIIFLLKIAFVTSFATNADYLIGYGYNFLMGGIREGTIIALKLMNSSGINSGAGVYAEIDKYMSTIFHFATDAIRSETADAATNAATICKNALFAVIAFMLIALPIVGYVALLFIGRLVLTFFRACFAYIYAVMGITFLLVLSPFFLSFYLFKHTRDRFDKWLGYLVSFTLQVILLFSFLAFAIILAKNISNSTLLGNLPNIVMYNQKAYEATSGRLPLSHCTLCDFKVVDKETCDITDASSASSCPDLSPTTVTGTDAEGRQVTSSNPDYSTKGALVCKKNPPEPIEITTASSADSANNDGSSQVHALLQLMGSGLIPLIVLVMIIEHLLRITPSIAQKLGAGMGASYATQLGGGKSPSGAPATSIPGESLLQDFNRGFNLGYAEKMYSKDIKESNSISALTQGVKDGFAGMVTGKRANGSFLYPERDNEEKNSAGSQNMLGRWLSDPGSFGL